MSKSYEKTAAELFNLDATHHRPTLPCTCCQTPVVRTWVDNKRKYHAVSKDESGNLVVTGLHRCK